MARQIIDLGTAGTQSGTTVRNAFDICNDNFSEVYGWLDQSVKTTSSPRFRDLLIQHSTSGAQLKIYETFYYGGAVFQPANCQEGSIEIIPIIEGYTASEFKLYFDGMYGQWKINDGGLGISGNSTISGSLAVSSLTSSGNIISNAGYIQQAFDNAIFYAGSSATGDDWYLKSANSGWKTVLHTSNGNLALVEDGGVVSIGAATAVTDSLLDIGGSSIINAAIHPRVAITSDANRIESLQLQNANSGTSAEMRFITAANDDTYLAFTQPSSGNSGTFFGKTKSAGSFIFSNSRALYLGTNSTKEVGIATNNTMRMTISSSGSVYVAGALSTSSGNDIQTGGTFKSSDGSSGMNSFFSFFDGESNEHTVIIKDGLIIGWDIQV